MPPERMDGGAIKGSLPTVRNERLCAGSESTLETAESGPPRAAAPTLIRTRVRAFLSGLFIG